MIEHVIKLTETYAKTQDTYKNEILLSAHICVSTAISYLYPPMICVASIESDVLFLSE